MNMNHTDRGIHAVTWRSNLLLPGHCAVWAVIGITTVTTVTLSLLQLGKTSAAFTVRATTPPIEVVAPAPTVSATPSASPSPDMPAVLPSPSVAPSPSPGPQLEDGTDTEPLLSESPGPGLPEHSSDQESEDSPHAFSNDQASRHVVETRIRTKRCRP